MIIMTMSLTTNVNMFEEQTISVVNIELIIVSVIMVSCFIVNNSSVTL